VCGDDYWQQWRWQHGLNEAEATRDERPNQ
jgi:hypothetical protein